MNVSDYLIQSPNPPKMCGISRSQQSQALSSTPPSLILQLCIQQWLRINSCQEPGEKHEQDTALHSQSFQISRRLHENWQSDECYREWMQVLWGLMEGLGKAPPPWDSPGKNTGVGCHFLFQCRKVKSASEVVQSCPTLRNPMDCSPPGSPVPGILLVYIILLWQP